MKVTIRKGFTLARGGDLLDYKVGTIDLTAAEIIANAHKLETTDAEAQALITPGIVQKRR